MLHRDDRKTNRQSIWENLRIPGNFSLLKRQNALGGLNSNEMKRDSQWPMDTSPSPLLAQTQPLTASINTSLTLKWTLI